MALAGYIVEETAGKPFHEYVEESIFKPLGMERSTFRPGPEQRRNLATGYDYSSDRYEAKAFDWDMGYPASMLVTTGTDMARFLIAHLRAGRSMGDHLLEASTFEVMHAMHFTHHPRMAGCALGFFERNQYEQRILEHSGHWTGTVSQLCIVPEAGVGFFFSLNCEKGSHIRLSLVNSVLEHLFPLPPADKTVYALKDYKERAHRYRGAYRSTRTAQTTVEKVAALFEEVEVSTSQEGYVLFGSLPYVEVELGLFEPVSSLLLMAPGPMAFREDDQGRVTHLTVGRYAYEKLAWYETISFQAGLVVGLGAVFLLAITLWPAVHLFRRRRRKTGNRKMQTAGRWLAWATCLLNLAFPVILYLVVKDALGENGGEFAYGMPLYAALLQAIPHLTTLMTLIMVALTALFWFKRWASGFGRLWFTLVTLAAALYVPLLLYWNLLGYQY
jgi:hypothetical protein